ncbi:MAG: type I methionyl aminopeptidase [Myxococcota bacterium]
MELVNLSGMRRAGRSAAATLANAARILRPGLATAAIDRLVRTDTKRRGGRPSQLGYHGFPASVCVSRNHVVCHGIPKDSEILEDGDIVNIDVTTELDGWNGDCSATFFVGRPSPEATHVVDVARRCRDVGIAAVQPGATIGDIAAVIMELAASEGCSIVEEYGGHGIGRKMHQPPSVMYVGERGDGMVLRPGMAITIEPMINLGSSTVRVLDDGWTVVTADGQLSAQFEHTVVVTEEGAVVTTRGPVSAGGTAGRRSGRRRR